MDDRLNPYAAPQTDTHGDCEPIPFAGDFTAADVIPLLPSMGFLRVLLVGTLCFILPFAAVPFIAVALGLQTPAEVWDAAFFILIMAAAPLAGLWLIRGTRRAAKLIAENPGFIGPLRGALSPHGVEIRGPHGQPISIPWSEFRAVSVRKAGLCLSLRDKGGTFVAVPSHCFAGYESAAMQRAIAALQKSAAMTNEPTPGGCLAVDWTTAPENSVRFDGVCAEPEPEEPTTETAQVGFAGPRPGHSNSWRQYGWVTENRIYSVVRGREYHDNWQVVDSVVQDRQTLCIVWRDQTELRIAQAHLLQPEQWEELLRIAARGFETAQLSSPAP